MTIETTTAPAARSVLYEAEQALPEAYRQVMQALRFLDEQSLSDSKDFRGFSRAHSAPGHDFATLWRERQCHLTSAQYSYAYRITNVYQRQLADAGLPLPSQLAVTEAQAILAAIEEKRRIARAAEQARAATIATAPTARPGAAGGSTISLRGQGTLIIKFDYNRALVDAMHALQNVRERLAQRQHLGLVRFVGEKEGGPYWEAPIEMLAQVSAAFPGFARDERVEAILAEREAAAREAARLLAAQEAAERQRMQRLAAALGKLSEPLKSGRVLYRHQREAIVQMARWGAAILAHDMGLGKTTQAAVLARAYNEAFGARIIIVGPKTLRTNWLREAASIGLTGMEYYTYEKMPRVEDMQNSIYGDVPYVLIVDEAQALQSMNAQRTKKAIPLAWGALSCIPMSGTPIKNGRPINIYPLLLMTKHPLVYAALPDGSPDEDEIKRLKADYVRRYCASDAPPVVINGMEIFDANGARRLDELNKMIVGSARGVIRKRKDQCLDLPKKVRKFVPVEMSRDAREAYYADLDAMWAAYEARLEKRIEEYKKGEWEAETQKFMATFIESNGTPETQEKYEEKYEEIRIGLLDAAEERMKSGEALVTLNNLRQCGSRAKLAPTIAMIREIMEQDQIDAAEATIEKRTHKPAAFVVFSAFVETAKAVASAAEAMGLRAGLIAGETKDRARQAAIDEFQSGARRVVSCVYGAGGVGVTLTSGTHVILLDRPWAPGDAEQAEDRLHRIGLEEDILALWMQLPEGVTPIDTKIDGILLQKQERVLKTLDGNLDGLPPDILFSNIASSLISEVMAARARKAKSDD